MKNCCYSNQYVEYLPNSFSLFFLHLNSSWYISLSFWLLQYLFLIVLWQVRAKKSYPHCQRNTLWTHPTTPLVWSHWLRPPPEDSVQHMRKCSSLLWERILIADGPCYWTKYHTFGKEQGWFSGWYTGQRCWKVQQTTCREVHFVHILPSQMLHR